MSGVGTRRMTGAAARALRIAVGAALALSPALARAQDPDFVLRFSTSLGVIGEQGEAASVLDFPNAGVDVAGWGFAVCQDDLVDLVSVEDGGTTAGLSPDFRAVTVFPGEGWTAGVLISFVGANSLAPGSGYELHVATYDLLATGTAELRYCAEIGTISVIEISDVDANFIDPTIVAGAIEIGTVPPFVLEAGEATGAPGEVVTVPIQLSNLEPVEAFSFGLAHDGAIAALEEIAIGAALEGVRDGAGPEFFHRDTTPAGGSGGVVSCILTLHPPFEEILPGEKQELARFDYRIQNGAGDGSETAAGFVDGLGTPAIPIVVTVGGGTRLPLLTAGRISVSGEGSAVAPFHRGDGNGNGAIELTDAIFILEWLFAGTGTLECEDIADVNDDGSLLITDPIYLLDWLFLSGLAIPPPGSGCGDDPSADTLSCATAPACP